MISWDDFEKIIIKVGSIVEALEFKAAKKPAYQLSIDFGPEIGIKKSSAQITDLYSPEQLVGKQIVAVLNFPPRQIGPFMSECLVLGVYTTDNKVVLLEPEQKVLNGSKIG
ncbi:MAG: tRNA-binding protein [Flavisolibacter sp.]